MIFPIPGGKKIGSHYLPRYTRYRVIAGRVIKGVTVLGLPTDTFYSRLYKALILVNTKRTCVCSKSCCEINVIISYKVCKISKHYLVTHFTS